MQLTALLPKQTKPAGAGICLLPLCIQQSFPCGLDITQLLKLFDADRRHSNPEICGLQLRVLEERIRPSLFHLKGG